MELGEKLRLARAEAGLSQRQLCEGIITRNMLSQIEHGTANPSMDTLKQLAARLGKPVSFFLEETAVLSPNQAIMARARELYDAGEYSRAASTLEGYRAPDEVYDRERELLDRLGKQAGRTYEAGVRALFSLLIDHSCARQEQIMEEQL